MLAANTMTHSGDASSSYALFAQQQSKGHWEIDVDCGSCCSSSTAAPASPYKISSSSSMRSQTSPPGSGLLMSEKSEIQDEVPVSFSSGSALHSTGQCQPCAWFWKPSSCRNGEACTRCHLCPSGEIKARKKDKLAVLRGHATTESADVTSAGDQQHMQAEAELQQGHNQDQEEQQPEVQLSDATEYVEASEHRCDEPNQVLGSTFQFSFPPGLSIATAPKFSQGSANHPEFCKPCAWFWKPQGCANGSSCTRCHLCPEGELKIRKRVKVAGLRSAAAELAVLEVEATMQTSDPTPLVMVHLATAMVPPVPPPSCPPVPPPPVLPPVLASLGSLEHGSGRCRPCSLVWQFGGCPAGRSCNHCHLCPEEDARMMVQARLAGIHFRPDTLGFAGGNSNSSGCTTASTASTPRSAPTQQSIGSVLHASSHCSPCAWFWKPQGCNNGAVCGRCHFCPPGEVKTRRKAKLMELRQDALSMDAAGVLRSLQLV